ncbi:MAG: hypothetical protein KDD94_05760 [Calditrichaeota bacterium]|nr:hypothetical protein [Calditrichota bacterium]
MNKKLILAIRIILYSAALYVVLDVFVFSSSAPDKTLTVYEKSDTTIYWEFFVKFKTEDSTWVVIQTAPVIQSPIETGFREAWTSDFENWKVFTDMRLKLKGVYLTENVILDRKSFLILANEIDDVKNNDDPNLNKLHRYHSFTAVFTQENKL